MHWFLVFGTGQGDVTWGGRFAVTAVTIEKQESRFLPVCIDVANAIVADLSPLRFSEQNGRQKAKALP